MANSENLLHDLHLFPGRFIQSWHRATNTQKAFFTTSQAYNSQSLARSLYTWGMWRGFLEDHDLSEDEFQTLRLMQSGGDPKSVKMDACVFFQVETAEAFNQFRHVVGAVAQRMPPAASTSHAAIPWSSLFVGLCEQKQGVKRFGINGLKQIA